MIYQSFALLVVYLGVAIAASAQASQTARFDILRTVIAEQAAARVQMPFGNNGIELTDAGRIDQQKLAKEIKSNGMSIDVGKVVNITAISFADDNIEFELNFGGKNKRSFWDRLEGGIGLGGKTVPVGTKDDLSKAQGSKVILKFAESVPADITPEQLKQLLDPVLDFNKSNFLRTGLESLPPEFKEAVLAKEARIGMDASTVILALGRPDDRFYETVDGVDQETWLYRGRGYRATFVTFEDDVVVGVKEYGDPPASQASEP